MIEDTPAPLLIFMCMCTGTYSRQAYTSATHTVLFFLSKPAMDSVPEECHLKFYTLAYKLNLMRVLIVSVRAELQCWSSLYLSLISGFFSLFFFFSLLKFFLVSSL